MVLNLGVYEYLLFLDTEASGLPRKWELPYSAQDNWPHVLQASWILYRSDGQKLKEEDHYILVADVAITEEANRMHRITPGFLRLNGKDRAEVLNLLESDLRQFRPLVVGHFIELDLQFLGAESYRAGMDLTLDDYPCFCTMVATKQMVSNPARTYLRLCDLYCRLFGREPQQQHHALADAATTAACFFELLRRGDIHDGVIRQQLEARRKEQESGTAVAFMPVWIISLLIFLVLYLLWITA